MQRTASEDFLLPSLSSPVPPYLPRKPSLSSSPDGDSMRCLLVRHLPCWLSREEKESLFRHFGAQEVIVMPSKGKMKNCVYVSFVTTEEAKLAMGKLHQLNVFGSRLVVEYAQPSHARVDLREVDLDKWACNTCKKEPEDKEIQKPPLPKQSPPKPAPTPSQTYLYPHPTPSTIANITNAIVCVPKLYVQVLHLMNKMNLPPPFGPPTPTPPLLVEPAGRYAQGQEENVPQASPSDEESSELESDEEALKVKTTRTPHPTSSPKRRKVSYKQIVGAVPPSKKRRREEGMEEDLQPLITQQAKRIQFHVPTELSTRQSLTDSRNIDDNNMVTVTYIGGRETQAEDSGTQQLLATSNSSHQQFQPAAQGSREEKGVVTVPYTLAGDEEGVEQQVQGKETEEEERFITLAELAANRMPEAEMREEHVFKNYSAGEPSVRLYLKNLAKQVEETDLRYIYGRYVNWSIEEETNMFDVRLMKSGRMKGQAFVGLPSEEIASRALRDTNGYLLHGRPIVVHFARSSRPKETGN